MSAAKNDVRANSRRWPLLAGVFCFVLSAQLWLVAGAGTDIPFHDQWNIEGQWLYPRWQEGSLRFGDFFQAFNEHRIAWTHALNLALFSINGQWDPLVQLAAIAILRAGCATGIAWMMGSALGGRGRLFVAAGVGFAFLPHLAWHPVLWGIESHSYFVLGFSLITLVLLGTGETTRSRMVAGLFAGIAALFAMGPAALVPLALLGLIAVRAIELRRWSELWNSRAAAAVTLLAAAWLLHVRVAQHEQLEPVGWVQFFTATGRLLAWPHVGQPWAALALNLPLFFLIIGRLRRVRQPVVGEDFVVLMAGWSVAVSLAAAWVRGGSGELYAGVPSRYVDFIVLLPLANGWAAVTLVRENSPRQRIVLLVGLAWGIFLAAGWAGLSAETWRGVIGPRLHDRAAPERLAREYQISRNPAVFAGQPRLLIPYSYLGAIQAVLDDPRLQGKLPPTFQPERPQGPLSRAVRWVLGR